MTCNNMGFLAPATLLTLTLCSLGRTHAQTFSGPDEARQPRTAEAFALARAVCAAHVWLGPVSGCQVEAEANSYIPSLKSPKGSFIPTSVLYGSFTRPNAREVLAQYCVESEGCFGSVVLLRQAGRTWKALGHLPDFNLGQCLTYPAQGGTTAAACLSAASYSAYKLKVVRWQRGRASVQQVFQFRWLALSPSNSVQCQQGFQVQPWWWNDRDRNADRRPDLTLFAGLEIMEKQQPKCFMGMDGRTLKTTRLELAFHWNGQQLRPTPATQALIARYGVGP